MFNLLSQAHLTSATGKEIASKGVNSQNDKFCTPLQHGVYDNTHTRKGVYESK